MMLVRDVLFTAPIFTSSVTTLVSASVAVPVWHLSIRSSRRNKQSRCLCMHTTRACAWRSFPRKGLGFACTGAAEDCRWVPCINILLQALTK